MEELCINFSCNLFIFLDDGLLLLHAVAIPLVAAAVADTCNDLN